ncbi:hypothetical protein PJM52_29170, partial [Mycobacterium kansasii]
MPLSFSNKKRFPQNHLLIMKKFINALDLSLLFILVVTFLFAVDFAKHPVFSSIFMVCAIVWLI